MSAEAPASFRASVQQLLRDRLLDAAASITTDAGWAAVTMSKIAKLAGVSRQTVYNELGTKRRIAEELVLRELARFLELVRDRMSRETDVVAALRGASEGALEEAASNPVLRAILETPHTGGSDLLPLLTTESLDLIEGATTAVADAIADNGFRTGLDPAGHRRLAEVVVRLVISHLVQPSKERAAAADDIAWIAAHLTRPAPS